ncbi:sensor domain-containing protein [Nocardia arthritidis]|uniref:sensor domain-containing protein n=1 Tax=Nocardia arthritidis TaxID=228602 RepID=UPI0007A45BD1|nr:sensor domain-containing protein [Nocardia arthritidis]
MTRACALPFAVAYVALVVGCGSAEPAEPAEPGAPELPPPASAVSAVPVTAAPETDSGRLGARLLGEADLPSGFTALPPRAGAGTAPTGASATKPAECAKVLTPLGAQYSGALAQASTQYAGPNFSSIDIDAASYPPDALPAAFSAVQETLRRCTRYSSDDATDIAVDYRIGGLTQPPVGDAAGAFQVRATSEGLTLGSSVAIVQVGSTLLQVAVTAPEVVDPAVLSALTAAQVRRLQGGAGP